VSLDERTVHDIVRRAMRRVRMLSFAEGVAFGVAAAAVRSRIAGLVVAVGYIAWRWRDGARAAVVDDIEQSHGELKNLLITWDEISEGRLEAKPDVRARVLMKTAARAKRVDLARVFPMTRLAQALVIAAVTWTVVGVGMWRRASMLRRTDATSAARVASAGLRFSATIQPPAYTGLPSQTIADPSRIEGLQGSALTLAIESTATGVTIEQDGASTALARDAGGKFLNRLTLTKTGYLVVTAGDTNRTIPVVVSPDALPSVRVTVPGRDLV
jgi:hypothetical protein